ncbi:MAG: HyuE hydantoin racemase [Alphaproteobacteria bacterium]|jgi:allantoin racemase|nr:HyuE hydantoin racemase [Alphaproteobacteria bacterium]
MRILYINPNATRAMTDGIVAVARDAVPEAEILGWTNSDGPPAIQGAADGAAALPGLLAMLPAAKQAGADVIVIACADDTGLAEMRAAAHCPVIGIGQAAYTLAALSGWRFSVVTTLAVSVPVIDDNIRALGFAPYCAGVRATGISVLEVDAASSSTVARLAQEIVRAAQDDHVQSVVLGCAGMAPLVPRLYNANVTVRLLDGVRGSAVLAAALGKLGRDAHAECEV